MRLTEQQEAIIESFRSGSGDLCVVARAGSGKSSTILQGVSVRPRSTSAMLCAFNKRIADDLTAKLADSNAGSSVRAKTLHGIGFRAITRSLGRRQVRVNGAREYEIALKLLAGLDGDLEDEARQSARLAALAKEARPDSMTHDVLVDLALEFDLASSDDDEEDAEVVAQRRAKVALLIVDRCLEVDGEISFSDMLWLPIVKSWKPDQCDLVCVDEAQDMSLAQLRLAVRVRRAGGRVVLVGDDRQAIYSWRGAAPGALHHAADALRAQRLALTASFRCGSAIIAEARKIVQDIESFPSTGVGVVRDSTFDRMHADAAPGDFVLSRTNAELARACINLIRRGTRARIVGNDLGPALLRLIQKLSKGSSDIGDVLERLVDWEEREVAKAIAAKRTARADLIRDQAEMLVALADGVSDARELCDRVEDVFADDSRPHVACSSVHRAKGLEADRVWILADSLEKVRPRNDVQAVEEANIKYVAITRARRELVWVR